ncbi:MAG: BrnA antitoxin family protein [Sulfuritalea sp.]|nr:BrnA antitoxin family protein [Sulfuritalea sp.]
MCFLAKMPTKAKPASTSKPSPATKAGWQSVVDAAPDGDSARNELWGNAIVTHGGGVTDTLSELRRARGQRGPQKRPRKTATAIRLSPEVTEFFKAGGRGWQTRIDEALREYVKEHKPG